MDNAYFVINLVQNALLHNFDIRIDITNPIFEELNAISNVEILAKKDGICTIP